MAESKSATECSKFENSLDSCAVMSAIISGYDCEFVDALQKRSECPLCLLVLREPHQATCCGKIFCKACITKIRDKEQPCPTCMTASFTSYPDKGLQQELYSCGVYCPKKTEGCDWEGELGELDHHLNLNPEAARKVDGCGFVNMDCLYCCDLYQRCDLERHQSTECVKRPLTCELCQEYKSTYDDVVFSHLSICKCRSVDCPNNCGDIMQHQELETHLSNHCDLSEVDCEFGHAGCEAKMLRKDLSSHMSDNMVSHMSLLAAENRQLKFQLENNLKDVEKRVEALERGKRLMDRCFSRLPPFHIRYPWKKYARWSGAVCYVLGTDEWFSEPFYSHVGGYKFRLKVWCTEKKNSWISRICLSYEFIGSEFEINPKYTIFITTSILDLESGTHYLQKKLAVTNLGSESLKMHGLSVVRCFKKDKDNMEICVQCIEVMNSDTIL